MRSGGIKQCALNISCGYPTNVRRVASGSGSAYPEPQFSQLIRYLYSARMLRDGKIETHDEIAFSLKPFIVYIWHPRMYNEFAL